jgi:hypothetical protein
VNLRIAFVLAFIVRLAIAYTAPVSMDTVNFERTGQVVAKGANLYAEQWAYNYAPPIAYLAAGAVTAARTADVPFAFVWRGTLSIVDLLNAALVYRITGKRSLTWVYLFNPATVLALAWWGQFDLIALMPILALCWYASRSSRVRFS